MGGCKQISPPWQYKARAKISDLIGVIYYRFVDISSKEIESNNSLARLFDNSISAYYSTRSSFYNLSERLRKNSIYLLSYTPLTKNSLIMIGLSSLTVAIMSSIVIMILLVISVFLVPLILIVLIISSTFLLIGTLIRNTEKSILDIFSRNANGLKIVFSSIFQKPSSLLYPYQDSIRSSAVPINTFVTNTFLDEYLQNEYHVEVNNDRKVQNDRDFINNGESVEISSFVEDEDADEENSEDSPEY